MGMNIKTFFVACGLITTGVAFAGECPASLDWDSAQTVARGIKRMNFKVDQPRLMENYIVRVDLREPGLRITGSHRAKEWGEPMPDYTNRVMAIDTCRQKTRDFLEEHRRNGTNMVFAVNTSPWVPWTKPFTHKYGAAVDFLVSDGEVVSHTQRRGHMLVIFTNNVAVITNHIDDALVPSVAIAHPGHGPSCIMKNGKPTFEGKSDHKPNLAPRTAIGLSADGRWLYALVVDGRQKGYSEGADMTDLIAVMKAAGASDAINMDGGGSSTLVFWDKKKKKAVIPNHHDAKRRNYRPVAINLGFYFENSAR